MVEIRLATADLLERVSAAALVQLLEAVETVAAVAHDLARLRHVPELLRELQDPDLRLDDLLFGRHCTSRRPLRLCRSYRI
jgi:hypothetical protein